MHVTLAYDIAVGLQDPALVAPKIALIPVDQEFDFLHMTKTSDVVSTSVGKVTRTIILQTDAVSDQMFPTSDELKAATRHLLSGVLGLATPGSVVASEPTVNP
jgi:hypothetical protein